MEKYFLLARFPLIWVDNDSQDPPSGHEEDSHLFYETDSRDVAEKLLELFRSSNPKEPVYPTDAARQLISRAGRGEQVDWPMPIFEIINDVDLDFAKRVFFRQAMGLVYQIKNTGDWDPHVWADADLPHDLPTRHTMFLYAEARDREPSVREVLGVVEGELAQQAPAGQAPSAGEPNRPTPKADTKEQPSPDAAPQSTAAGDSDIDRVMARKRKVIKWLAEAMSLVQTQSSMSDAAIARAVRKHPSTLTRNKTYQRAAKTAREGGAMPEGRKDEHRPRGRSY